jgi:hypothetical protein
LGQQQFATGGQHFGFIYMCKEPDTSSISIRGTIRQQKLSDTETATATATDTGAEIINQTRGIGTK